jgi:poly-gamma-glutamate capsule biosynthesis protein CapA/YwtB (metallophosphatase superfamily)
MWSKYNKRIICGLGIFVIIFFLINKYPSPVKEEISPVLTVVTTTFKTDRTEKQNIKLAFVGDMMLDRGVKNFVYKNFFGNYEELFSKVKEQLQSYDFLFANLEGPISNKGQDIGGLYSFRIEPLVIPILRGVGFDIFSLANNHTYNWGNLALTDTMKLLSSAGIEYIGAGFTGQEAYEGKVLNIKGINISFLAFSEFGAGGIMSSSTNPGLAVISEEDIIKSVSQAKNNSDLVVVSYHFGEEYVNVPNNYQRKYAELAIDYGADLIIGHHAHVIQTLEQYKNVYIIYSLGNFIFDQYFSVETMQGGLLEVEIGSKSKKIEKVNLRKVFLNKYFQVDSIK